MLIVNVIQVTFQPQKTAHTIANNAQQSMDQDRQQILGKIAYVMMNMFIIGSVINVLQLVVQCLVHKQKDNKTPQGQAPGYLDKTRPFWGGFSYTLSRLRFAETDNHFH